MTDSTPDFHEAFNPNYKFPPMPAPPVEMELARIEAAAMLAETKCPHCDAEVKVIGHNEGMIRAIELHHEPGCPDFTE